jgi:hypothetical protein
VPTVSSIPKDYRKYPGGAGDDWGALYYDGHQAYIVVYWPENATATYLYMGYIDGEWRRIDFYFTDEGHLAFNFDYYGRTITYYEPSA